MSPSACSLLIVDDSRTSRELLCNQLTRQGYQTVGAESGPDAIELLQTQSFDLVLLDIEMPGMNGLEVLMNIRQSHSLTDLPIIMVSGRDQTGDMVATLQLGANDYVVKPYNFPLVLARIQTQLTVKAARSGASPALAGGSRTSTPSRGGASLSSTPRNTTPAGGSGSTGSARGNSATGSGVRAGVSPNEHSGLAAPEQTGSIVPGYEMLEELGRGGMGVVYKARHICMNRIVALKVINQEYLAHADSVRRFYQEVQAVAQLHHPNIVLAYDAGQSGATHYLTMEYVDGTDLSKFVKRSGPLPIDIACECARQTALGLQHAHEKGLVHRDIKPSNLLVANGPGATGLARPLKLKILDLGLALLSAPGDNAKAGGLTQEGRWVGTPDYMSPEQAMSPHHVDIRSDLYSLGCTLYYLLTGRVPFPEPAPMEKILKHNLAEPTAIEKLRPEVPLPVAAVVRRLMAKRPDQRFATPQAVADALKE